MAHTYAHLPPDAAHACARLALVCAHASNHGSGTAVPLCPCALTAKVPRPLTRACGLDKATLMQRSAGTRDDPATERCVSPGVEGPFETQRAEWPGGRAPPVHRPPPD